MENLLALKGKRTVLKSQLTKFKNAFQDIKLLNPDEDSIVIFESKLSKIENILEDFNSVQLGIEQSGTEYVEDNKERDEFEHSFHTSVPLAKRFIEKYNKSQAPSEPIRCLPNEINRSVHAPAVRLPSLDLPRFDGKYENWLAFQNGFESLVHTNESLSDVNRFQFLRSCLSDEAADIIDSLQITGVNYEIAWDLLKARFNNKRLLINRHIAVIYELPGLTKQSAFDLRKLTDSVEKNIRCLNNIGQNYEQCDLWIIFTLCGKLDYKTRNEWEEHCGNSLPTLKGFLDFIRQKCITLENVYSNSVMSYKSNKPNGSHHSQVQSSNSGKQLANCLVCKDNHAIYNCPKFLEKSVQERIKIVRRIKLCYKCLKSNHSVAQCKLSNCRLCQQTHNILLHISNARIDNDATEASGQSSLTHSATKRNAGVAPHGSGSQALGVVDNTHEVLLSTAMVRVISKWGESIEARVLIDSGSQSNFISSALCDKLGASQKFNQVKLYGINGVSSDVSYKTNIRIMSRVNTYACNITCLVVPKVTGKLPSVSFARKIITIPHRFELADPQFYVSRDIDILLGADKFYDLICEGQYVLGKNMPTLQNTLLGYVLGGKIGASKGNLAGIHQCIIHTNDNNELDCSLASLWEDEIMPEKKIFSVEENLVESHFLQTVQRNVQGRFTVAIPFKNNIANLGESRLTALKRFFNLERKLNKNSELKRQYSEFMREYIELGHMNQIKENDGKHLNYYIPHHPVVNKYSSTTKLRVVFDSSMRTNTGLSLNDVQMVGPTIQTDLFQLLIGFRQPKIVITADIAKMYRQVQIAEHQHSLQRIFWREDCAEPLYCYALTTVTYGLSASPYLAIRCLYQLGVDFATEYPKAAVAIRNNFYVDDLLSGAESVQEAIQLRTEISNILNTAVFQLRKWNSNVKSVIPCEDSQGIQSIGEIGVKTLGVWWNAYTDTLQYSCDIESSKVITKREILSIAAKIFDPFGFLSPVSIKAKFVLQKLWQLNKSWDEPLPYDINQEWTDFVRDLPLIRDIKVPRRALAANANFVELHGFCDASECGYGACIYFRCFDQLTSVWTCRLVCAKAKVSPIKVVNLPRLELNSAMLLSRLVTKLRKSLLESTAIINETLWSDSTITLGWTRSCPSKWKTYVANRVSEIQINTKIASWRHVTSGCNPADLITRGTSVSKLHTSDLWWTGPTWLTNESVPWPKNVNVSMTTNQEYVTEQRSISLVIQINNDWSLIDRYSSLSRLIGVTTYCVRFFNNCRTLRDARKGGKVSVQEMNTTLNRLIKIVQVAEFAKEHAQLEKSGRIDNKSRLISLTPFICDEGLMRVGGRLQKTKFEYSKKHPILLPQKHRLTVLITEYTHVKNLHCGQQALLAHLREKYWPVGGRYVVKKVVHNCVKCFRTRPITQTTVTGQLPESRVSQAPPFFTTGVDYAGPFFSKDKRSRGNKIVKAYVCLFICFAVKAVHLELVSDLTTEGFMAALRRFIARRGKPKQIHSDNATNFVGARNEFKKFLKANADQVAYQLQDEGIEWHFIPPRSPHFGGIWEAGIKSVKTHLLRVLGNANLVFEDFYTVLVQIEAVLNSRPLCPLSNDPNDMSALTPGHFLIGRSLTGAPDLDITDVKSNRLSRFQRAQQLQQHFWARWSREYVNTLQQ